MGVASVCGLPGPHTQVFERAGKSLPDADFVTLPGRASLSQILCLPSAVCFNHACRVSILGPIRTLDS
jgi:hypothetical protein